MSTFVRRRDFLFRGSTLALTAAVLLAGISPAGACRGAQFGRQLQRETAHGCCCGSTMQASGCCCQKRERPPASPAPVRADSDQLVDWFPCLAVQSSIASDGVREARNIAVAASAEPPHSRTIQLLLCVWRD